MADNAAGRSSGAGVRPEASEPPEPGSPPETPERVTPTETPERLTPDEPPERLVPADPPERRKRPGSRRSGLRSFGFATCRRGRPI
jgi:hypothetical protein